LWRFIFNTTFGLLGTFDVASELGLQPRREDFGQTLAVWGWTDSGYVVLPILGPSTFRDTLGNGVEWFADPVDNWALEDGQANFHKVVAGISKRTEILPATDQIDRTSLDKYTSYKSVYTQNRDSAITNDK
jgi:phospholipid-binding lipoprotein MlaA